MKPTKKLNTTVRLTRTLKAELKKQAAAHGMSMTDYVESVLSKSLKRN